jgi:ABC-2 type transport system permease protein
MTGSFLAAWTKLRRPALLWGTYGATAAVTALFTTLTFVFASDGTSTAQQNGPNGPPGSSTTIASLSQTSGLMHGLSSSLTIFGIIALCVAAAAFASEYTTGTLRNLLIREPHRLRLLGGIWAAVVTFTVGAVLVATVVAGVVAASLAGGQGVDTSAWYTADGLSTSLRTIGDVALAAAGYATLGSALGVLLRASIPAVAIGFGWLFVGELIVSATVDGTSRWLPGQLLSAVATNGTASVTFGAALLTVGAYLVVAATAAGASFVRRDVTA